MKRILVINPGSTSTKIAVYDGMTGTMYRNAAHDQEELERFGRSADQFEYRKAVILEALKEADIPLSTLSAVVARGGNLGRIRSGAYSVNDDMIRRLTGPQVNDHASNVGAVIAKSIADENNIPSYIYDGVTVDEMPPVNKVTGLRDIERYGLGHCLNTRSVAIRYAESSGKSYKDVTVIVAHLGGGITVNLHHNGIIEDNLSDQESTFSPTRAGFVPEFDLLSKVFREKLDQAGIMRILKNKGGLMSHLGTADSLEVERRIAGGDEYAKLVYDAMILNISKNISLLAPVVYGKIDAVIITGGMARSDYIVGGIRERVGFLAPVTVYPGENEMEALAFGALRVLEGTEQAKEYIYVP